MQVADDDDAQGVEAGVVAGGALPTDRQHLNGSGDVVGLGVGLLGVGVGVGVGVLPVPPPTTPPTTPLTTSVTLPPLVAEG